MANPADWLISSKNMNLTLTIKGFILRISQILFFLPLVEGQSSDIKEKVQAVQYMK